MLLLLLASSVSAGELVDQLELSVSGAPHLVGEQVGVFVRPLEPIELRGAIQATVVVRGPRGFRYETPITFADTFVHEGPVCDPSPDLPDDCGDDPRGPTFLPFDGSSVLIDPLREPEGGLARAGTYRVSVELPDGDQLGPIELDVQEHGSADLVRLPRGFRDDGVAYTSRFHYTGQGADGQTRTVSGDRLNACYRNRGGSRVCVQITEPLGDCGLALSKHTRGGEPVAVDDHALWRFYENGITTREAWCSGERLVVVETRGPDVTREAALSRMLTALPAAPIP